MSNPQIALKVVTISKSYQTKQVVDKLSFEVNQGEIVGLLGANGAGKTTAFYITMGLIKPDSGHVYFNNIDVTNLRIEERARLGMGYLAQEPSVFRSLSVKDNVLAILQTLPLKPQEMEKRCKELLSELRLENIADKKAASLSGGERRRLEITRSLVTNPAILLLDEPFANIDPISVSDVKNLIKALSFRGIAILITDHNAREIFSVVDRSYIMKDGKLIAEGDSSTLLKSQVAKESYLGEGFKIY